MNKRVLSFFISIFLIFYSLVPVYAVDETTTLNNETVEESTEDTEISVFSDFENVDKETIIKLIDEGKITNVINGTNTKDYYAITSDGKKIWFIDKDEDVSPYLTLKGIDISKSVINREKTEEEIKADKKTSAETANIIVIILFFAGAATFMIYRKKKSSALPAYGTEAKSASKKEEIPTVKFADIEGVEGLKNDVMRVVDSLKNPEKYKAMGARPTKGIILYGPPGTGKTLLAKAIAGEAGVPFFSAVGSDFVEMYVGVGASRVRELYKKARKAAPCIVFIDEVDAVAGQRGNGENTERDQTINALLSELDGFTVGDNVVTICATNRLDMLDNAFKRAGRFDLKLAVGLPDRDARIKILKIHGKNKTFAEDVKMSTIADKTVGFSGAELESLLNEAALVAVDKNENAITYEDIDDAFFKIVMQGNKKSRQEIDETTRVVAWHEAGHTLVTKLLTNDKVPSVTIIGSTSGAGGVTFRNPEETMLQSKKYLRNNVKIMYGGRAAEQIYFHDNDKITTGASQDIKQATQVLKEYLGLYGMGELGMIDITQFKRDLGDIIDEASKMSKLLYAETVKLLEDNINILEKLATELIKKETLTEEEIDDIIANTK